MLQIAPNRLQWWHPSFLVFAIFGVWDRLQWICVMLEWAHLMLTSSAASMSGIGPPVLSLPLKQGDKLLTWAMGRAS
jgi:hypothetical protein